MHPSDTTTTLTHVQLLAELIQLPLRELVRHPACRLLPAKE